MELLRSTNKAGNDVVLFESSVGGVRGWYSKSLLRVVEINAGTEYKQVNSKNVIKDHGNSAFERLTKWYGNSALDDMRPVFAAASGRKEIPEDCDLAVLRVAAKAAKAAGEKPWEKPAKKAVASMEKQIAGAGAAISAEKPSAEKPSAEKPSVAHER